MLVLVVCYIPPPQKKVLFCWAEAACFFLVQLKTCPPITYLKCRVITKISGAAYVQYILPSKPGGGQMQSVSIKHRCSWLHLLSFSLVPFQAESKKCCHSSFHSAACSHTLINLLLEFPHRYFCRDNVFFSTSCLLSWRLLVPWIHSGISTCQQSKIATV